MSETVFKAPKAKKSSGEDEMPLKRPRTSEDFYAFCTYVLEYANYELLIKQEELREKTTSPMGSTGSVTDSVQSESNGSSAQDDGNKGSEFESAKSASAQEWNWNGIHFSEEFGENYCKVTETSRAIDEDSYDLVTCYCSKPFAGRPMIECSKCLTWIHLSCAKIKKSNIPEVFFCVKCKGQVRSEMATKFPSSSLRNKNRLSV